MTGYSKHLPEKKNKIILTTMLFNILLNKFSLKTKQNVPVLLIGENR